MTAIGQNVELNFLINNKLFILRNSLIIAWDYFVVTIITNNKLLRYTASFEPGTISKYRKPRSG